ncbi:MAG: FtsL-like putative cell division protein [Saprospiraceae bacterium]|jgi:hypothetical protein|nr:hypothetical protein [Chitinophagia bacterium]
MRNISKNMGFILLLTLLGLLYIANAHRGERKLRKINKLRKEVNDAKANYQEVKSETTYNTTESQLIKKLEPQGLKMNTETPILIKPERGK